MARKCEITGKGTTSGNNRSHALNSTKRTFKANLQKVKIIDPKTGKTRKALVSTKALKSGLVERA